MVVSPEKIFLAGVIHEIEGVYGAAARLGDRSRYGLGDLLAFLIRADLLGCARLDILIVVSVKELAFVGPGTSGMVGHGPSYVFASFIEFHVVGIIRIRIGIGGRVAAQ